MNMAQIDTLLGHSQISQIRQFIQERGLEEDLINFVAKADKQDFQDWLGC